MTEIPTPMEQRKCSECGSQSTYIERRNQAHWYDDKSGGALCKSCYEYNKYNPKSRKRITRICADCGTLLRGSNIKFCNLVCKKRFKILR